MMSLVQDCFLLAFRNLKQRKTRSLLTVIGIFLAVMTIFVLASLSLGLSGAVNDQFQKIGVDKFIISPKGQLGAPGTGGAVKLTTGDVKAVEKVQGVKTVTYYPIGNAKVSFNNKNRYGFAAGIPLEKDKMELLFNFGFPELQVGKLFKPGDKGKVVIGSRLNEKDYFQKPVSVGNKILINDREFEVIGILKAIGSPPDDANVYISFDDFKEIFNSGERVDSIIVQINPGQNIKEVASKVDKKLMNYRNVDEKNSDFSVQTPEEILASFSTILNILTGFLIGVGSISLVVGGIGIANTMYTSILERNKDIGTMKAIGARNSDILLIFIFEAGIFGLIGGIVGLIFGIGIAKGIEYIAFASGFGFFKVSLNIFLIMGILIFAFLTGIVSGFLPSLQASKLKPVDTLRYE